MSLEPITKKDIENIFNKILKAQIDRKMCNDVIPVNVSHSRVSGNLSKTQIVQEEDSRFRGNDSSGAFKFLNLKNDELVGLKANDLAFKTYRVSLSPLKRLILIKEKYFQGSGIVFTGMI